MQQINKLTAVSKAMLILIFLIIIPTAFVLAGRGGNPADMGSDPSGAPIDGGISLLVAAGIGYGAKKVKEARKKPQKQLNVTDEVQAHNGL